MANTQKHDLRDGMSRIEPSTNAKMPGLSDSALPTEPSGEHSVKPTAGSKGGVAEGQVTKSN
ncbi:MAG TPA: hypothetical protein VIG39_09860 [Rhizomicrobium sp.]|jgi:hypothetical protein